MSQKPKICLNMIVKNEAHIIKETLESVYKYCDYYIINDTGSTDNTVAVIKEYFDGKNIPGEIHIHEFRTCSCHSGIYKKYSFFHFGWNRTYALNLCIGKSDYILVIDADDIIIGKPDFRNLTADCYSLTIGTEFVYKRTQIFKNDFRLNWKYVGALHEYPDCDKQNKTMEDLPGDFYLDSRRLGDRNKDPQKYLKDALIFEELLLDEPNNERNMFYCAQSYFDYKDYVNAIKWYKKRIEAGKWYEEVYYSYYKIAEAMEHLEKYPWEEVEKAFLAAHNYCNNRGEPLFRIACHYSSINDYENCYKYAKMADGLKFPKMCSLFVSKDVYEFRAKELVALSAFKLGKFSESYCYYKKIVDKSTVGNKNEFERIKKDFIFVSSKINDIEKKNCAVYVGSQYFDKNHALYPVVASLTTVVTVYLVGDHVNHTDFNNVMIMDVQNMRDYYAGKKETVFVFDYLFLLDDLSYFTKSVNIKTKMIGLIVSKPELQLVTEENMVLVMHDNKFVNHLLQSVKIIGTVGENVHGNFCELYGFPGTGIMDINDVYQSYTVIDAIDKNLNIRKNKYTMNCKNMGFRLLMPDYIDNVIKNKEKYPFAEKYVHQAFLNLLKYAPNNNHLNTFLIKYYVDMQKYDDAMKIINGIKQDKDLASSNIFSYWKAVIFYKKKKYEECFELANRLLDGLHFEDNPLNNPEDKRKLVVMRDT